MKNMQKYEQLAITEVDAYLFGQGTHYEIYNKMGAHVGVKDGKEGVYFAVWAPAAREVYVIGEFNNWNAYGYDMKKISDGGIYDLFIPGAKAGDMYKFLIISQSGEALYKADPYANQAQLRPETASIVADLSGYEWKDSEWVEKKKTENHLKAPLSIYECHLGSWKKKDDGTEDGFYTYRELAPELAKYVTDMGYTHIELMGIAEYPYDGSWGYQVTGYYAPTARYGTPKDFMYFVDYMHEKGIGVILDWVPAHFPKDAHGLANFDGSCVYEYADPRKGEHPDWGTKVFDYSKNEVANFLIANGMFWVDKFHIDGLRVDAVASMLYLNYCKNDGEWVPNKYGGNENLEAVEFIKHLNSVMAHRNPYAHMIAEESTSWPNVTKPADDDGLGFTLKWNMGWMNDFLEYVEKEPIYRKYHHYNMTFASTYAYSEKYVLVLSHDEVVHGKKSMLDKMPGDLWQKFANLRVAYGFAMAHPGKKLLFMGGEFGQFIEWDEKRPLDWFLLEYDHHKNMLGYVKALNHFYLEHNALWKMDFDAFGFEWINADDKERSIYSFVRRGEKKEDTLLVICNFTPVVYEDFRVGVPFAGEWEEVFNSDSSTFGGSGVVNTKPCVAEEGECDHREYNIGLRLAPLSVTIYQCKDCKDESNK